MGCFSPDPPPPVDYAGATSAGVEAQTAMLPLQRQIEAAAKMGGKYTDPATGKVYDFTGTGDADQAAKMADAMAQAWLSIQQKYGSQAVQQALDLQAQANPQGVAMRKQLGDLINQKAGEQADTKMSSTLQSQIQADLEGGGKLSPSVQREVEQATLRNQEQLGNTLGNASMFTNALNTGSAAEQRRRQNQAISEQFLASGTTPQDVEFRKNQQDMGNMGSFLNGQTPQAQFAQMSGAQQGAAPWMPGQASNLLPTANAGAGGVQNAQYNNAQQYNYAMNTVNDWVAGVQLFNQSISSASSAAGAGKAMCWVAREVFGQDNPKWLMFRQWLLTKAPRWFRWLYGKYGERFARFIHDKPRLKEPIGAWMEGRIY